MRAVLILTLAILYSINCFGQNIGDSANIILYLVDQNFNNRKTKDLLKHGELRYKYDVKYDGSIIREIVVTQKNELFLDLDARSDVKTNYLFYEGVLIESQTEFLDLSYEFVKSKFDVKYGYRNHGYDMYFTPNYKQVRHLFENDGYAVIMFSDYLPSNFHSLEFQQLIIKKQEEYIKNQD